MIDSTSVSAPKHGTDVIRNARTVTVVLAIAVISLFTLIYARVFALMAETWWNSDSYSFGFLVPAISGFIAWTDRKRLSATPVKPDCALGVVVIIASGALLFVGRTGGIVLAQEISIVATIAGLVLAILGRKFLAALAFPLAYLLIMVPFLEGVSDSIHMPFQLFAAGFGSKLINMAGVPAYRYEEFIELPNITLKVAVLCSGVRYLISIIAIGIPLAYITQRTTARRVMLVAFGVVIAIIANGFRVGFVGLWAYYMRHTNIHGPSELFQGLFVAQVAFVALFVAAWFLARIPVKFNGGRTISVEGRTEAGDAPGTGLNRAFIISGLVLASIAGLPHIIQNKDVPLRADPAAFPMRVSDWQGSYASVKSLPFRFLEADTEVAARYRLKPGDEVTMYLGYYRSQHQDKEMINYLSKGLHAGSEKIVIGTGANGSFEANKKIVGNEDDRTLMVFWYEINGRRHSGMYSAKLATMADAVFRRRTNGGIVVLTREISDGDVSAAEKRIKQFYGAVEPALERHLP